MVPSGIGVTHVHRCLLVAEALADRGHEVLFAVRDDHRVRVAEAGFVAFGCDDVTVPPTEDAYSGWTEDRIEAALDQLATLITALDADVVVADFHPIAAMAAERAGVASVALIAAGLAPGAARLTGAQGTDLWAANQLLTLRGKNALRAFAAIAREQRLRPRNTYAKLFAADITLVTELHSLVGPLGHDMHFIGPLLRKHTGHMPPPPPTGTARVHVTLGDASDPRLVDLAVRAIAGRPSLELVTSTCQLFDSRNAPASGAASHTLQTMEITHQSRC